MDISEKITLLNQSNLESFGELDRLKIVERFTNTGLKILGADFGFIFWKQEKNKNYRLLYKTPNTPYEPNPPRPHGYNSQVEKTKVPYMGLVKKESESKYDLTRYMKSIVILPIVYKEHTYGNLVLCFKEAQQFSKTDRISSIALGNSFAQALTINQLHHNLTDIKRTLDHTPQPKIIFDPKNLNISYYNQSLLRHTNLTKQQLHQTKFADLIHPSYRKSFEKQLVHIVKEKIPSSVFETAIRGPNNRKLPMEILLQYVNSEGRPPHLLAIFTDLRERKKSEEQIKHAAFHDTLTGLPNRFLFTQRLDSLIRNSKQKKKLFGLMFVDLDHFKSINDNLGHMAGDELLREVAIRIKRNIKRTDTVSRFGGDEFVILLGNISSPKQADQVARRLKKTFSVPFKLSSNQEVYVNFSIGISTFPRDGKDNSTLLKNADSALYRAKQEGGNSYQHYRRVLANQQLSPLEVEKELRRAITNQELRLNYQPIVDVKTGRVISTEALVRWEHPTMGTIPPDVFIPYAEESGLIIQLGDWVFSEACRQLKEWRNDNIDVTMNINVSARELLEKNKIAKMQRQVKKYGLSPKDITLELTETFLIKNPESSINTLKRLQKLGFNSSLDDFGAGYTSLNYLKFLPINSIKISKLFIDDCVTNLQDSAIIQAIITVSHQLGVKVVSEGVEAKDQVKLLKTLKCDMIQGHFYNEAQPAGKILPFLKKRLH